MYKDGARVNQNKGFDGCNESVLSTFLDLFMGSFCLFRLLSYNNQNMMVIKTYDGLFNVILKVTSITFCTHTKLT